MKNLKSIAIIEEAINNNWDGEYLAEQYRGLPKDVIVEILSGFLPQANNGLNDEAVNLICEAIQYTTSYLWRVKPEDRFISCPTSVATDSHGNEWIA